MTLTQSNTKTWVSFLNACTVVFALAAPSLGFAEEAAGDEPSVQTDKEVYAVREEVKITFKNSPGNQKDLVAYADTARPDRYSAFAYTKRAKSGVISLKGPKTEGKYEARLYREGAEEILARYVFWVGQPLEISLRTAQTSYEEGDPIEVLFEGAPGNNNDFLVLVPRGTPDGQFEDYVYLKGAESGSQLFSGVAAGEYEIRLHVRGSRAEPAARLALSVAATDAGQAAPSRPTIAAMPQSGGAEARPSVRKPDRDIAREQARRRAGNNSTSVQSAPYVNEDVVPLIEAPRQVAAGERFVVTISNLRGQRSDLVTMVSADEPDTKIGFSFNLQSAKEGEWTFPAGSQGEYEIRVYYPSPRERRVAARLPLTVLPSEDLAPERRNEPVRLGRTTPQTQSVGDSSTDFERYPLGGALADADKENLNGTWKTTALVAIGNRQLPVVMTLEGVAEARMGQIVGWYDYPTLGCGGRLEARKIEARTLILQDDLDRGQGECATHGQFRVTPDSSGTLRVEYHDRGGRKTLQFVMVKASGIVEAKNGRYAPVTEFSPVSFRAPGQLDSEAASYVGSWRGTMSCQGGRRTVTLNIMQRGGPLLRAEFAYFAPESTEPIGHFLAEGVTSSARGVHFTLVQWLRLPVGAGAERKGLSWRQGEWGEVIRGCDAPQLVRQSHPLEEHEACKLSVVRSEGSMDRLSDRLRSVESLAEEGRHDEARTDVTRLVCGGAFAVTTKVDTFLSQLEQTSRYSPPGSRGGRSLDSRIARTQGRSTPSRSGVDQNDGVKLVTPSDMAGFDFTQLQGESLPTLSRDEVRAVYLFSTLGLLGPQPCMAYKVLALSAFNGHAPSVLLLANLTKRGGFCGALPNPSSAISVYAAAIDSGTAHSKVFTAAHRLLNARMAHSDDAALANVIEEDNRESAYLAGLLLADGMGSAANTELAEKWFLKAARQGHAGAQVALATSLNFAPDDSRDGAQIERWFRAAADQDNPTGNYHLGNLLSAKEQYGEAHLRYAKAAARGHIGAMVALGTVYREGLGVRQDDTESLRWFHKAASRGSGEAMVMMGEAFFFGRGVPVDEYEAMNWFGWAAEFEHVRGYERLWWGFRDGRGMMKDDAKGNLFFARAAGKGSRAAQVEIEKARIIRKLIVGILKVYGAGIGIVECNVAYVFSCNNAGVDMLGMDLMLSI